MHKLFRVRTCDYTLPVKNVRVCIDYEIGRCDGPCEDLVSESDYTEIIREAVLFLTGRHRKVVKILREKMKALSEDLRFEDAASYRDRLEAIKRATRRQKVVSHDLTDWDTIAISREDEEACGVVFEVRDGCLIGRQHYFLSVGLDSSDREVTREFLTQYYSACSFVPKEIILRHDLNEREAILDWLHRRSGGLVEMRIPQRGDKKELLLMAERNAELFLKERQLKRENSKSRIPNTLAALQRDLHLSKPPRQIEAIDISNIQGTDPVASLVCFVDGKPRKSEYRHYKIVGIDGPNDFAMMEQVVVRRFKRLMEEGKPFPDLLLIDGGKGQLSTAVSAIKNLGIDQPVIGLAKKLEEVFLPDYKDPQNIPKTSSSLKLLQALRNESHRFALSFHRKLRQKRTLASGLDYIEGVGPERKRLLLRHFGSVKRLKCATEKEIAEVVGIGPKLATIIFIGLK
jgi:excinuclease ABC subunit C|tara:strand:- start:260 stop:1633 length:1374 start_codon:yes stop_codon:yes gene_type:complete